MNIKILPKTYPYMLQQLINLKQEQIIKSITAQQQKNQLEQSNPNHLTSKPQKQTHQEMLIN